MKKHILLTTIALIAFTLQTQAIEVKKFPFEISFNSPMQNAEWIFLNSNEAASNSWVIASDPDYAYGDSMFLFMSEDGGLTRTFTGSATNDIECLAYCPIDSLPSGQYILNFRCRGEFGSLFTRVTTSIPNLWQWDWYYWYDYVSEFQSQGRHHHWRVSPVR